MRKADTLETRARELCGVAGVDPESYRLAEHFLSDDGGSPSERIGLARQIQDAVEAWFQMRLDAYAPCLSPAEQKAQGERCGCMGADDYCPCQNAPDLTTKAQREHADNLAAGILR